MLWLMLIVIFLPFIARRIERHFQRLKKEKNEMKDIFND